MSDQVKLTTSAGQETTPANVSSISEPANQLIKEISEVTDAIRNSSINNPCALPTSSGMVCQPVSEIVRGRLLAAGEDFRCNNNIAEYISDDEKELLVHEVTAKMDAVLRSLVIDVDNDHNTHDTARRVAKMFIHETFGGRFRAAPKITSFPNVGYKDLYTAGPISIKSTCAHHFQNIVGRCWIGVFPEGKVIGLSKFNRLVHWISERPQIQEEMTSQIADALEKYAETPNIAVVLKAEHHCMTHRGVREHESDMTTAIMRGKFRDDASLKDEFYKLALSMKGHS
jgi:GTP cyclohydrolase I